MTFYKTVFSVSFLFLLLTGCGDDLSGLPDSNTKTPAQEPDSFTFETATDLDIDSSAFPAKVFSQVPANTTRYYKFTLGYFDVGTTYGMLRDVSLVSSTGVVTLAWYSPDQVLEQTDNSSLDFSSMKSTYYTECCDGEFTFFMSVDNQTSSEIDYQLDFSYVP